MFNKNISHPITQISFINSNQAYVIEASAGTGKTWTIERLFVKALLEQNQLPLEKFLVVTFTNDAVNELKSRILDYINFTIEQLIKIKNGTENTNFASDLFIQDILLNRQEFLEKDISILTSAVQNFDCTSIYTIHGFCNKILANYQFDCNISYPFKLVNNKNDLISKLVRDFFRENIVNNHELIDKIDVVYQNLERILAIDKNKGDFIEKIAYLFSNKKILKYVNSSFKLAYDVLDNPDLTLLTTDLSTFNSEQLTGLENEMLYNLYSALAKYVEQNFNKLYKRSNQLDFNDLIDILADGVSYNKALSQNIFNDYPVLFIDEFQDTDSIQWQIFSEIYQLKTKDKRGSVIVVGDPKQAIYRFRGADINVYLDAKHIINNTLTLSENRRSHPHIINFINQLFGNDNNNECFGRGINYDKIEARVSFEKLVQLPEIEQLRLITNKHGITDYKISSSPVQIITISGNKADEKEEQLTFALVSEILLLLNANPNLAQSMAILVPEHKDAVKIVKKLSEYGVKASLSKRENIFATKTAEDLYKILEATINLSNVNLLKKALATYLFNIPYYNLNNFIDNSSSILGDRSISECFYAYKEALVTHDIMSLIYLLISDLKLIYLHHKIKLSNREIANLIQLGELIHKNCFHMISQMELLYWFRNKMQDVVNGKSNDADLDGVNEELVRLDNDEKQIKVMTQHTSKGLEFDILFCPNFKKKLYNITTLTHLHETGELKKSELGFLKYRDLSNMQYNNMQYNVLSYDGNKLKLAHKEDDYEVNRLNYVTLTRAKSRLYIYLTEITKTSRGKIEKYYGNSKPSKIDELFGFNCRDTKDLSHRLFNYPQLFRDPKSAIKDKASLPGVDVYSRSLIDSSILNKLKLQAPNILLDDTRECVVEDDINFRVKFSRQSYSSIVRKSEQQMFSLTNNDLGDELIQEENNTEIELEPICYRYSVLNQLKGAKFGLLIHSLCENYPLNREITENLLINANISLEYCDDLMQITNEIFYYKILHENVSLKEIKNRINELAFCLKIKSEVVIEREIKIILGQFYGENHPYTIECNKLDIIRSGFLSGFIDVFFEHNGKYYVLDYKTNSLDDYTSSFNINNVTNPLLIQTANHHYYLQYLLYLVAVKRYLEFKLNIDDASDFLGGAIYFYVRGIFVDNDGKKGGILIDDSCQKVVSYLDQLFIK